MSCCSSSAFPHFPPPLRLRLRLRPLRSKPKTLAARSSLSDPSVLKIAEKLEDSFSALSPPPPLPLQKLRDSAADSLLSKSWPSSKDEPFRFTDLSFLKPSDDSSILPAPFPSSATAVAAAADEDGSSNLLTIVDGHVIPSLPAGAFVGSIAAVPEGPLLEKISAAVDGFRDGDLFWDLNGVGAADIAVVYVPAGARAVDEPVHVRLCYSEGEEVGSGRWRVSNPRVLVLVEKGAEVAIVEEHLGVGGGEGKCYWANSGMEIVIGEGGKVSHSYVQRQSRNAAHIKWTATRQESSSNYELIEISAGARLSRHNLHVQQLGPDTVTEMSAFHVSRNNQIQDLHSRLILDHPRGYSRQLHKCIVCNSSGRAVFDGNIRVNRLAQQTDAGQLTRTLLLASRATANVKPNLQIVADDVKCTHGAAISDLEEESLFYFKARGIDQQTAREALILSFGGEVLGRIPFSTFRKSINSQVRELLAAR